MSHRNVAAVFAVLAVAAVVMTAYSTLALPDLVSFDEAELLVPAGYTPPKLPVRPGNIAGNTTARPDLLVRILIGNVFQVYGGSVRMEITNNDTRTLFLEELAIDWVYGGNGTSVTLNRLIGPKETFVLKALAMEGPPLPGIHDYRLGMRLLQLRNNRWYRMASSGDGWLHFTEQSITVKAFPEVQENPMRYNTRMYYAKVNDLVDFSSEAVAQAAQSATAGIQGGYSIGSLCAVFDWLYENIVYTEDPGGGDVWYSPDETLDMMAGDCEDYAMLLAAMTAYLGGQSRVYLTRDHAFAAVFVGRTSQDLENATAGIRGHYRTGVQVHAFRDDLGYWMVADPLGSFHMGGLAVGQEPYGSPELPWPAAFPESGSLHSIDVTGLTLAQPIWLEPLAWAGMAFVFGLAAMVLFIPADKGEAGPGCGMCSADIGDDLYTCPNCQAAYHRHCAFTSAHCPGCGFPVQYPPPPPLQ